MYDITQSELKQFLSSKYNLFISGGAGSGKTYAASDFANTTDQNIALTATTGVAAINLGGETLHRFLGLGIATRPFELPKLLDKWRAIKKQKTPWDKQRCRMMEYLDTIIVDEVSMLRRDQFELVDGVLSFIKELSVPFGGVRMVLVGDFFQLPPVVNDETLKQYPDLEQPFCFQSPLWTHGCFQSFNITDCFRQSDPTFIQALSSIRLGIITDDIHDLLHSRVGAKLNTTLQPVKLFAHKYKVEDFNLEQLKHIPHEKVLSTAEYTGKEYDVEILKKECQAEEHLYFAKDAQVMMITNDPEGRWSNGTMGVVDSVFPVRIRLSNGTMAELAYNTWERKVPVIHGNEIQMKVAASCSQYPFKLAWASTIHKSQSATYDFVSIDLSNCFTSGQAYVALSRCRSLEGITLVGYNRKSIFANPAVKDFYGVR